MGVPMVVVAVDILTACADREPASDARGQGNRADQAERTNQRPHDLLGHDLPVDDLQHRLSD